MPDVLAMTPAPFYFSFDRIESLIGAKIREREIPLEICSNATSRKLRIIAGVESQPRQYATGIKINRRQCRVTDFDPGLAGAAIAADPNLSDRSNIRAEIKTEF